jgi:hypothetical protein
MKRKIIKLKWTGPDKGRRINGKPLREGEVFDIPESDSEYLLTLPGIERADSQPEPESDVSSDTDLILGEE